ncbi:MAG: hypothetical protein J0L81_04855 [Caulobacterales bacterium]|nr:hypothetical protein [Caulobacterales bacterium]
MPTKGTPHGQVNGSREKSYRAYHDALMARLEGDVGLLFLLHAIHKFDWRDTPRDTGDAFDIDHDYWERHWHMREKARRMIQGVEPWPRDFLPWKQRRETLYYLGIGKRPPWLDSEHDDSAPSLARLRRSPRVASLSRLKLKARA